MQRYFIDKKQINKEIVSISDGDFHHIKNVMRFKPGQQVIVNTYDGEVFLVELTKFDKNHVEALIIKSIERKLLNYHLDLGLSLTKKDHFELALKKVTELGVSGVIPLETERSVVQIKDYEKKKERYISICKESAEQSERNQLPIIYELTNLNNLSINQYDHLFFAYARDDRKMLKTQFERINQKDKTLVLIGPEGGFSKKEIELLTSKGFESISLGDTILRAETAAMYVASVFRFMVGE